MEIIFAYITVPDREMAQRIGLALVEERLAACVNIIPGMATIYRWQGTIEEGEETILIAKTTRERFQQLAAQVRARHPYSQPCIVALPIVDGDPGYLQWIEANAALRAIL